MVPNKSCRMVQVRLRCGRVGFARTADVKEGVGGREGVGPDVGIGEQFRERSALVVGARHESVP